MLFKVKAYFYSGNRFFTRPEVFDVNNDGVDDLIYSDYNLTAVNGKTGKLLWRRELNTDSFSISIMTVQKQLKKNQFSYVQYNRIGGYDTDYSLVTLDSEGRFLSKKHLFQNKNYPATILNKMISNRDESIFALEMLVGNTIYETLVDNVVSSENYILFSLTQISIAGESKIIGYGLFGNVYLDKSLDKAFEQFLNENKQLKDKCKQKQKRTNT
jgi:hypothetical protein